MLGPGISEKRKFVSLPGSSISLVTFQLFSSVNGRLSFGCWIVLLGLAISLLELSLSFWIYVLQLGTIFGGLPRLPLVFGLLADVEGNSMLSDE